MTAPTATGSPPAGKDIDDDRGIFVWLGARLPCSPRTVEYLVGAAMAVVAAVFLSTMVRDSWFGNDELEFLTNRTAWDVDDLVRPFGGHWTTWAILLMRGLYRTFGLDWWPWFFIPRLIGLTFLVTVIWRVVRTRGADPLVGLFTYAALLVLGPAAYHRSHQLGTWIVYSVLIACALIINDRPAPTRRDRVMVGLLLVVALLGNGYAVAVIGGITAALLLARRLVVWLPSLVPPLAVYLYWYVAFRGDIKPKVELTVGKVLGIPLGVFRVLRTAIESVTAVPQALAGLLVIGLVVWVGLLLVRRRLDLFDAIMLLTLLIGLSLISIQRLSVNSDAVDALRYGVLVTFMLALALVPHIRVPPTFLGQALVVVIGCWVVAVNVDTTQESLALRAENGREHHAEYVAAAELMLAGEPVVTSPSLVSPGPTPASPGLETDELRQLLDDGYAPEPLSADDPDREVLIEEARGVLRMNPVDRRRPKAGFLPAAGTPPTTEAPVNADGCVVLTEGEPVEATVRDGGTLSLDRTPEQALDLTWTDGYGTGTRRIDDPGLSHILIELATPVDAAVVTLEGEGDDLTVCGFRP